MISEKITPATYLPRRATGFAGLDHKEKLIIMALSLIACLFSPAITEEVTIHTKKERC
ncbi:hypothetical protein [Spartinivicinus poritis]|uniref:Uncharacterized protein n=1 Tax=Spartinivicinus poritis TaxID=2994640 RepID=A0ABT5U7Z6_9GAMM|nr:hypothetical protein [Spartinivicinus sp. A2-2]MDE1462501.1 hypothetical protein [Spartinivicinus sp. A2-2]